MQTFLIVTGLGFIAGLGLLVFLLSRAPIGEETAEGFKECKESAVNEMKPAPTVVVRDPAGKVCGDRFELVRVTGHAARRPSLIFESIFRDRKWDLRGDRHSRMD